MANLIAQPNVALAETLARALQGLRPSPVPTITLGRFIGHPQRSGDPTLVDWLDDFGVYARQMGCRMRIWRWFCLTTLAGVPKKRCCVTHKPCDRV